MGPPDILKAVYENDIIRLWVEINVREVKLWIGCKRYWSWF